MLYVDQPYSNRESLVPYRSSWAGVHARSDLESSNVPGRSGPRAIAAPYTRRWWA